MARRENIGEGLAIALSTFIESSSRNQQMKIENDRWEKQFSLEQQRFDEWKKEQQASRTLQEENLKMLQEQQRVAAEDRAYQVQQRNAADAAAQKYGYTGGAAELGIAERDAGIDQTRANIEAISDKGSYLTGSREGDTRLQFIQKVLDQTSDQMRGVMALRQKAEADGLPTDTYDQQIEALSAQYQQYAPAVQEAMSKVIGAKPAVAAPSGQVRGSTQPAVSREIQQLQRKGKAQQVTKEGYKPPANVNSAAQKRAWLKANIKANASKLDKLDDVKIEQLFKQFNDPAMQDSEANREPMKTFGDRMEIMFNELGSKKRESGVDTEYW